MSAVRYDGLADWYDAYNAPAAAANEAHIADLLGPGDGWCLDLGCGTGLYAAALSRTGRTVVGLDRSADQLRVAAQRGRRLMQADAAALPFPAATFSAVAALWVSTDVDDFAIVLREAARVLRPDGVLLFYGVHPCFNGPHVEPRHDDSRVVHPTYRRGGWHAAAPWWGHNIRRRVGMRHMPLAELLNGFVAAGLCIDHVVEPRAEPVPYILAVRARRAHPIDHGVVSGNLSD
jgi:ubiquinone/menaquinone biosynthesis C-methylase UbiE